MIESDTAFLPPTATVQQSHFYECIPTEGEYINVTQEDLDTLDDLMKVFDDLYEFAIIGLSIRDILTTEYTRKPQNIEEVLKSLRELVVTNSTIGLLEMPGNNLFECSCQHPANEHVTNYFKVFTDCLIASKVHSLDLSGNVIIGNHGQLLSGLSYFSRKFMLPRLRGFVCQRNNLHSQAFCTLADGINETSSLTYLDLSDNIGGLGYNNESNSTGMKTLCARIAQLPRLRTLRLARNHLNDEHFEHVAYAVKYSLRLQVLDLSGNNCKHFGIGQLKDALLCLCPSTYKGYVIAHSLFVLTVMTLLLISSIPSLLMNA